MHARCWVLPATRAVARVIQTRMPMNCMRVAKLYAHNCMLTTVCSQLYAHNCMLTTVCSQLYGVPQNCMVKLYVCRSYVKLYALIVINYLRKRFASNSLVKLSVQLK